MVRNVYLLIYLLFSKLKNYNKITINNFLKFT